MDADAPKRAAAEAAGAFVEEGATVGAGTGSTVSHFISALAAKRGRIRGTVASSEASAARLREARIPVFELNDTHGCDVYVDGADEVTEHLSMIKGGGGALTREKVVAAVARKFVCICDASKLVPVLGRFPLPIEVLPIARSYVGREVLRMGAQPELRQGFVTDNGNQIIDCHGFTLLDPARTEAELDSIAGTVTNGIFARRPADVLLLGEASGVRTLTARK